MSIALITDSSADVPKDLVEKHKITVVPLTILFGHEQFKDDGKEITLPDFYEKVRTRPVMPRTTQPSPGDFLKVYNELLKDHDTIIGIYISKKMSGTIDSAELAKKELPDKDITIVNSELVHMPCAALVLKAAEMIAEGKTKDEILSGVEEFKNKIKVLFVPSTLEFLKKGGRIGRAKGLLASLLEIKPILTLNFGEVSPYKNTRRWAQAKSELISLMKEMTTDPSSATILVSDSDWKEEGDNFADRIKEEINPKSIIRGQIGCVVGSHIGPGALAVTFYE